MTHANWSITILSLIVIVLAVWPDMFSSIAIQWIIIVAALLNIIIVWSGCNCKCECDMPEKTQSRKPTKQR
jgi:hypothetical protein